MINLKGIKTCSAVNSLLFSDFAVRDVDKTIKEMNTPIEIKRAIHTFSWNSLRTAVALGREPGNL